MVCLLVFEVVGCWQVISLFVALLAQDLLLVVSNERRFFSCYWAVSVKNAKTVEKNEPSKKKKKTILLLRPIFSLFGPFSTLEKVRLEVNIGMFNMPILT